MIPKSGRRFSDEIMRRIKSMTRKSMPSGCDPMGVQRFSDEVMPQTEA